MSRRVDLPGSVRNVLGGLFGVLGYLFRSAWLMLVPKAVLVAKLLAAQSQLAACVDAVSRKQAPKPRFTPKFRGATSLDGPATQWCLEYAGRRGASRSQAVETTDSGKWKTVTFEVPDMRFGGAFRGQTDFRIASLGPADVTVKLVRLIEPEPPSVPPGLRP